ncbi:ABC transporter ATP-binding protein [Hoeflea alexandrii]|uniref:ABC transporter ATP-binding protein n=1 Tax=Hoeflea alexandrii TaxID=288436 RepID=UPI0022AED4D6|nr:ABC transporter ATP-binding protein [Hoeflea alexandrii]MCZ4292325.1 ABC transporter ATP-binding protein [Hoeflea alexandrii]
MSALLQIRDVFVRFRLRGGIFSSVGTIDAVTGVSLDIEEGKTYGIVGESGSGKTTLARAVAGLHHASEGSILYRGQELRDLPEAEFRELRREIVMMFQDPIGSLSPRLTIKSLITEPFRIQGMGDRDLDTEAKRLLTMVGLPAEFAARYPYQISGGQARRVGVARALALDPKLLIADEPTAGLDVSIQGEMLNLLARLQDEMGLAIMIITHNLNVVRHITDTVGIMYMGKLVEEGPTEEVFARPQHPYTLALLAANPEPDPDAQLMRVELSGEPPSILRRPKGCEFHTRCPFVQPRCSTDVPVWTAAGEGAHRCHFPEIWTREEAVAS